MKVDEHFHYTKEGRVLRVSMAVAENKRCCMSEDQDQMGMTSCNLQNQQLYEEYLQKMTAFYRKHPHAEVDKLMTVFFFNEVGGVGQKKERPKDNKDSEKPASSIFWSRFKNKRLGMRLLEEFDCAAEDKKVTDLIDTTKPHWENRDADKEHKPSPRSKTGTFSPLKMATM